jgi:DNA-directed RNA polymerase subunit RPC12/RpoP
MTKKLIEYKCEKCGAYLSLDGTKTNSKLCKSCEAKLIYGVSDNRRRFRKKNK